MNTTAALTLLALALAIPAPARADPAPAAPDAGREAVGVQYSSTTARGFYDVLEDLMADFEADLKNGNVQGLRDVSIRNVATSENVPPSFKSHLELNITERILRHTRTRVIQCLACKARKVSVKGDQVVVESADNSPSEMTRVARIAGIQYFMDVAFSYTAQGMALSMSLTDPDTGGVLWSRAYNSETSRAAALRRGVDHTEAVDARDDGTHAPSFQYRASLFYSFDANVSGLTGCMGLAFRMMERYDQRRKEVGFELDVQKDASTLVSSSAAAAAAAAATPNLYGSIAVSALFMHAWNLFGDEENLQGARASIFGGIGGTFASGYLGGLIRGGYEWRLARHWAFSGHAGFRAPATFTPSAAAGGAPVTVTGVQFGLGVHYIF